MYITEKGTPYSPSDVGYNAKRLDVLNDFLKEQMDKGIIRCANYCISRDNKIFADTAIGTQSYKSDEPLQNDAIQAVCSVTKVFTAAAIFRLFEDGKLRLSQSIADFIPEFKGTPLENINITHLLTHTSGFALDPGTYPDTKIKSVWYVIKESVDKGNSNWKKAVAENPEFYFPIGTQWGYSTFGFILLGEIIGILSGKRPEDYITDEIFIPCGMYDTTFRVPEEKLSRCIINDEEWEENLMENMNPKDDFYIPSTGGGAFSTAQDLVKFANMLLNGGMCGNRQVLGRKAVEKFTSLYTTEDILDHCWGQQGTYRAYSLGFDMRFNQDTLYSKGTFFHEGAGKCSMIIDPVEKLVAVYFVPYIDESNWIAEPIWNTFNIIWSGLM